MTAETIERESPADFAGAHERIDAFSRLRTTRRFFCEICSGGVLSSTLASSSRRSSEAQRASKAIKEK